MSQGTNEALREKGIDFDIRNLRAENLLDAPSDLELNVQDGKEKLHVYVE